MGSSTQEQLLEQRAKIADGGEPLFTRERAVNQEGQVTLKHSIPRVAVDLLGLTDEDTVAIEVYDDGYFVRKKSGGQHNDHEQ